MKRTFTITVESGKTTIQGKDMTLAEASGILNYFIMRNAMVGALILEEVREISPKTTRKKNKKIG